MAQRTLNLEGLERRFVVVGLPMAKVPTFRKGYSHPWYYYGGREVYLCDGSYIPFFVRKEHAQELLERIRPTIPVAFGVSASPATRKLTYVIKPIIQQDVLDELTIQVPIQLYLKSKQIIGSHMFALAILGYRGPTLTEEKLGMKKIPPQENVCHRTYKDDSDIIVSVGGLENIVTTISVPIHPRKRR